MEPRRGNQHRELFGAALERDRFECLVGAMARGGLLSESADSFEKDGRVIEYRRQFLSAAGRDATDSGGDPRGEAERPEA